MMRLLTLLLALSFALSPVVAKKKKKPETTDRLINRRVLILDFANQQKNDKYEYLEISIPEAYIEPLEKTGSFEIMNRNVWKKLIKTRRFKS